MNNSQDQQRLNVVQGLQVLYNDRRSLQRLEHEGRVVTRSCRDLEDLSEDRQYDVENETTHPTVEDVPKCSPQQSDSGQAYDVEDMPVPDNILVQEVIGIALARDDVYIEDEAMNSGLDEELEGIGNSSMHWGQNTLGDKYGGGVFEEDIELLRHSLNNNDVGGKTKQNQLLAFYRCHIANIVWQTLDEEQWTDLVNKVIYYLNVVGEALSHNEDDTISPQITSIFPHMLSYIVKCPCYELVEGLLDKYIATIFDISKNLRNVDSKSNSARFVSCCRCLSTAIDLYTLLNKPCEAYQERYKQCVVEAKLKHSKLNNQIKGFNEHYYESKLKILRQYIGSSVRGPLNGPSEDVDIYITKLTNLLNTPPQQFDATLVESAEGDDKSSQLFHIAAAELTKCLRDRFTNSDMEVEVEVFGSALSGLTTSTSDVDLNLRWDHKGLLAIDDAINQGLAWLRKEMYRQWPDLKLMKGEERRAFIKELVADEHFMDFLKHHNVLISGKKVNPRFVDRIVQRNYKQLNRNNNKRLMNLINCIETIDGMIIKEKRLQARVPIVKVEYTLHHNKQPKSIEADISLGSSSIAYHNSLLLKAYSRTNPLCKALLLLVKRWTKARCISNAANGYLSSYTYNILVIYYLQQIGVVPCFHETRRYPNGKMLHEKRVILGKKYKPDCGELCRTAVTVFDINPEKINDIAMKPPTQFSETLLCTFRGLLLFYLYQFDFHSYSVSIRSTEPLLRRQEKVPRSQWWSWSIEDPYEHFDSSCPRDLGCVLRSGRVSKTRTEMKRALLLLYNCVDVTKNDIPNKLQLSRGPALINLLSAPNKKDQVQCLAIPELVENLKIAVNKLEGTNRGGNGRGGGSYIYRYKNQGSNHIVPVPEHHNIHNLVRMSPTEVRGILRRGSNTQYLRDVHENDAATVASLHNYHYPDGVYGVAHNLSQLSIKGKPNVGNSLSMNSADRMTTKITKSSLGLQDNKRVDNRRLAGAHLLQSLSGKVTQQKIGGKTNSGKQGKKEINTNVGDAQLSRGKTNSGKQGKKEINTNVGDAQLSNGRPKRKRPQKKGGESIRTENMDKGLSNHQRQQTLVAVERKMNSLDKLGLEGPQQQLESSQASRPEVSYHIQNIADDIKEATTRAESENVVETTPTKRGGKQGRRGRGRGRRI